MSISAIRDPNRARNWRRYNRTPLIPISEFDDTITNREPGTQSSPGRIASHNQRSTATTSPLDPNPEATRRARILYGETTPQWGGLHAWKNELSVEPTAAQKNDSVVPSLTGSSQGPLDGEALSNQTGVQVAAASRRPGWNAPLPGQLPLPGEGFGVGGGGGSVSRKPDTPILPDHDLHEETGEDESGPNPGIGHNSKVAPDPSEIQNDGDTFEEDDPPSDESLEPVEEKPAQDDDQNEDPENPEEDTNQPPSTDDRDFRQTPPDNYGSILGELPSYSAHGKKSRNKPPEPHPDAAGKPHKIIEKPGRDGQYTVHWGDGSGFQYRGSGKAHGNISRPNVKVFGSYNQDGTLRSFKKIRKPTNDEYLED